MRHIESQIQCECVMWFKLRHPNKIIFAIPNGGKRNAFEALRMKNEGVLAGIPDTFIPHPTNHYNGLFIEFKTQKGKHTENQKKIINKLIENGYCVKTVRCFDEFKDIIEKYFSLKEIDYLCD